MSTTPRDFTDAELDVAISAWTTLHKLDPAYDTTGRLDELTAEKARRDSLTDIDATLDDGIYATKVWADMPESSILWRKHRGQWSALKSVLLPGGVRNNAPTHENHPADFYNSRANLKGTWADHIVRLTADTKGN